MEIWRSGVWSGYERPGLPDQSTPEWGLAQQKVMASLSGGWKAKITVSAGPALSKDSRAGHPASVLAAHVVGKLWRSLAGDWSSISA